MPEIRLDSPTARSSRQGYARISSSASQLKLKLLGVTYRDPGGTAGKDISALP